MYDDDVPFRRAMQHVLDGVQTGTYAPGGRLPSITGLAELVDVSRATAARAMDRLRWIGLVTGPVGGIARVATEPRRSAALAIVDEAERVRKMPE